MYALQCDIISQTGQKITQIAYLFFSFLTRKHQKAGFVFYAKACLQANFLGKETPVLFDYT